MRKRIGMKQLNLILALIRLDFFRAIFFGGGSICRKEVTYDNIKSYTTLSLEDIFFEKPNQPF